MLVSLSALHPPAAPLAVKALLGQRRCWMHLSVPRPGNGVNVSRKNEEREVRRATGAHRRVRGVNSGSTRQPSSSSRPQSSPAVQPGDSPFHSRPGELSEKATSPSVTDGTSSLPTALNSETRRALRSPGILPFRPHALAVTPTTPARGADTPAVKQCGRKAGRMRSRRARGRARQVFAERACA